MQRDFALLVIHIYGSALGVSSTTSSASTQRMRLAEAQPLPTWRADPRPLCNAGASRERPSLSFIVLFCSALLFDFPFASNFSISSSLYSPNMPSSDSSVISALANSSPSKSQKSPCSAGGLLVRVLKLNAIWRCFPYMCLWWFCMLVSSFRNVQCSATWKCL